MSVIMQRGDTVLFSEDGRNATDAFDVYRKRFSEMEYKVVRAKRFGFSVIVLLARGGSWLYWRPTRAWAEYTGAKRLRRELRRLDLMYERDNPGDGVKAKDLGIHFQMTTEELTLELARRDAEDKKNEMVEWDSAFHSGQEKAS